MKKINVVSEKLMEQVNNLPVKQSKRKALGIESFIHVFEGISSGKKGCEITLTDEENSNNSALAGAPLAAANQLNAFLDFCSIKEIDTSASSLQLTESKSQLMMQQKIAAEGSQYPQQQYNELKYFAVEGELVEPADSSQEAAILQKGSIRNRQNNDFMFSAVKDKPVEQSIQENTSNSKNGAVEISALRQSDIHQKESIPVRKLPEKLVSIIQSNIKSCKKPVLVQIKLEPEHLGEVVIKLAYKKGDISAQFITGSVQTKEVLENSMDRLKEALAQHQVHLQESPVSVVEKGGQMPKSENLPPVEQSTQENAGNSRNGAVELSAIKETITIKNITGQSGILQKESIPVRELPERLMSILQSNIKSGEKPVLLQMKLEPEHLGEVVIKLAYKKGEISAQFITGSVQAKEVLESTMVQLKEALAQHQVHLQESSVFVAYNGGQFMQQQGKPGSRKYLQLLNDSYKGEETPLSEQVKPQPVGGVDYFI